jgi:hypothetical protein
LFLLSNIRTAVIELDLGEKQGSGAINQLSLAMVFASALIIPTMYRYKYLIALLCAISSISIVSAGVADKAEFCTIPRGFPCVQGSDCCPGVPCKASVSGMELRLA